MEIYWIYFTFTAKKSRVLEALGASAKKIC